MSSNVDILNTYNADAGQETKNAAFVAAIAQADGIRKAKATITSAAAATPVSLIPASDVPDGYAVEILDMRATVGGATQWGTTANVDLRTTTAGTVLVSMVVALLIAQGNVGLNSVAADKLHSSLKGGALVDAGQGVNVVGNANGTGSDLTVTVYYRLVRI